MESETRFGVSSIAPEEGIQQNVPDWWPYAPEFPHWQVWRGVAGLLYARRPRSSPPRVVRAKDTMALRDLIRRANALG